MSAIERYQNADDIRLPSQKRLPRLFYDYIEGGGFAELTVARNRRGFDTLQVRQRVMVVPTPDYVKKIRDEGDGGLQGGRRTHMRSRFESGFVLPSSLTQGR
jgi:hypothetical protein